MISSLGLAEPAAPAAEQASDSEINAQYFHGMWLKPWAGQSFPAKSMTGIWRSRWQARKDLTQARLTPELTMWRMEWRRRDSNPRPNWLWFRQFCDRTATGPRHRWDL